MQGETQNIKNKLADVIIWHRHFNVSSETTRSALSIKGGRGAFPAYRFSFRSSRLTSSTHNLTSVGEATKCKLNIQCNRSVFKEKGSRNIEPTVSGCLQKGHSNMMVSLFGCAMLQAARSDLLNPSRGIWWFHLLRACIPPCGAGAMRQEACRLARPEIVFNDKGHACSVCTNPSAIVQPQRCSRRMRKRLTNV
jgi:hypothetical protein